MNLNELYTQIITENSRSKQNRHPVEGATHSLEGVNPSCGDDIILQLKVENGKIEDGSFVGDGCAISQASADIMLDMIIGRSVDEAKDLAETFLKMIKGEATDADIEKLEEAGALQDISHMPARVKCAVLGSTPWKSCWITRTSSDSWRRADSFTLALKVIL